MGWIDKNVSWLSWGNKGRWLLLGLDLNSSHATAPPSMYPGQMPPATILTPYQIWIFSNRDDLGRWHWPMGHYIQKDTNIISQSILRALGLIKTSPYDHPSTWQYFWPKQLRIWTNNGHITANSKNLIWGGSTKTWAGWAGEIRAGGCCWPGFKFQPCNRPPQHVSWASATSYHTHPPPNLNFFKSRRPR